MASICYDLLLCSNSVQQNYRQFFKDSKQKLMKGLMKLTLLHNKHLIYIFLEWKVTMNQVITKKPWALKSFCNISRSISNIDITLCMYLLKRVYNFIKMRLWEIFKNTFFTEKRFHPVPKTPPFCLFRYFWNFSIWACMKLIDNIINTGCT